MKHQIPVRIIVLRPLVGVTMMVQRGRDELLATSSRSADRLVFDFELTVDATETRPNFLWKYAQGRKMLGLFTLVPGRMPISIQWGAAGRRSRL